MTGEAVNQLQSLTTTPDHNDQGHPLGGLEGVGGNPYDYMESLKPLQFGKQQAFLFYIHTLIHTVHVWRNLYSYHWMVEHVIDCILKQRTH